MNEEQQRWDLANGVTALGVIQGLALLMVFSDGGAISMVVLAAKLRTVLLVLTLVVIGCYIAVVMRLPGRFAESRRGPVWRIATRGRIAAIIAFNIPLFLLLASPPSLLLPQG